MAEERTGYTLETGWKPQMQAMNRTYYDRVIPPVEAMLAGLRRVDAGRTQIAEFENALELIRGLAREGEAILAVRGAEGDQVADAQRAAGGLHEVYGDK